MHASFLYEAGSACVADNHRRSEPLLPLTRTHGTSTIASNSIATGSLHCS